MGMGVPSLGVNKFHYHMTNICPFTIYIYMYILYIIYKYEYPYPIYTSHSYFHSLPVVATGEAVICCTRDD